MLHKVLLTILAFVLIPLVGFADDGGGAKIGLAYGFTVPDADNTNPRQMWGLVGSSMISPKISLGGYYLVSDKEQGGGAGGRDFKFSVHGLSLTYNEPQGNGVAYFGMKLGLSKLETKNTLGESVILSPYHYGVVLGYDYSLWSWMSFGFEGNYLHFEDSDITINGNSYVEGKFNAISFLMSLKFIIK